MSDQEGDFKVWWIPQLGIEGRFEVPVETQEQGEWLCEVLAKYDLFQYEQRVKPDYANTGGVVVFENGEWIDYEDDDA